MISSMTKLSVSTFMLEEQNGHSQGQLFALPVVLVINAHEELIHCKTFMASLTAKTS